MKPGGSIVVLRLRRCRTLGVDGNSRCLLLTRQLARCLQLALLTLFLGETLRRSDLVGILVAPLLVVLALAGADVHLVGQRAGFLATGHQAWLRGWCVA